MWRETMSVELSNFFSTNWYNTGLETITVNWDKLNMKHGKNIVITSQHKCLETFWLKTCVMEEYINWFMLTGICIDTF